MIILFTQLIVIATWLLTSQDSALALLGKWSLYTQWLVLLSCGALCMCRNRIAKLSYRSGFLAVIALGLIALLSVELVVAGWLSGFSNWDIGFERLARFALADLLVLAALLRFFSFLASLESRNKAESQSRIEALQSRIQPHFLFNSLNTISELTATQPAQAEQAIHSLSMLFRASLENNRKSHSLENELTLCRRYVELEHWRVGDRLHIDWQLHVKDMKRWSIPKLIVQPLIENAIVHGVQKDGSIDVTVDIRETAKDLSLKIENKVGKASAETSGHGIALDNIRERLFVLFDDQQAFRVKQDSGRYSVIMRFPKVEQTRSVVS